MVQVCKAYGNPPAKTSSREVPRLFSLSQTPPFIFPICNYVLCIKSYYAIVLNIISGIMGLVIPISYFFFLGFLNMHRWLLMWHTQTATSLKAGVLLLFVYLNSFNTGKFSYYKIQLKTFEKHLKCLPSELNQKLSCFLLGFYGYQLNLFYSNEPCRI